MWNHEIHKLLGKIRELYCRLSLFCENVNLIAESNIAQYVNTVECDKSMMETANCVFSYFYYALGNYPLFCDCWSILLYNSYESANDYLILL